jgi:hypothetical protein
LQNIKSGASLRRRQRKNQVSRFCKIFKSGASLRRRQRENQVSRFCKISKAERRFGDGSVKIK